MPLSRTAAYRKDLTGVVPMQHRHFKTIAAIIRDLPAHNQRNIANHFASYLARSNPNFDWDRFVRACTGDEPGTVKYLKAERPEDLVNPQYQTIRPGNCPHAILVGEHYRPDGSCKCDDPNEAVMTEWGYHWSDKLKRWA